MNKENQFTGNGYLEKNLDKMREKLIDEDNRDMIILVVGSPGSGKSALTAFCYKYLRPETFSPENVDYTHDSFIDHIYNGESEGFIWYDEGYNSFYRRNAMSKKNKVAMSALMQYRFKNYTMFINFQNISDIEPDLLYKRSHAVIRVVKKGFFHFYSQMSARSIDIDGNKTSWPDPDFKGTFPDPEKEIPEAWKKIEQHNQESLQEEEKEEEVEWLRTGEVAEKLSVTRQTVNNWCNDGKVKHLTLPNAEKRIPKEELDDLIET